MNIVAEKVGICVGETNKIKFTIQFKNNLTVEERRSHFLTYICPEIKIWIGSYEIC